MSAEPGTCPQARCRVALWLPLFDELSDPVAVARLAAEAEGAGWGGTGSSYGITCWQAPGRQVADAWTTLAAIATAAERLGLDPADVADAIVAPGRRGRRDRRHPGRARIPTELEKSAQRGRLAQQH